MGATFISYARADSAAAGALYEALTHAGFDAWLDTERLQPGSKWKTEIAAAIRGASAFIAILSAESVNHRGYVQNELREALLVLRTVPANQIYLIPARLEDVHPTEVELGDLTWVDLFPAPHQGYQKIIGALQSIPNISRLRRRRSKSSQPQSPKTGADTGIRAALLKVPVSSALRSSSESGVYITIDSTNPGVKMPSDVLQAHPTTVVLALQHQYEDLRVRHSFFDVLVWFSGRKRRVRVPFAAVQRLRDLEGKFNLAPDPG